MKPEISTAVMIERLRVLASESQDGVLLSSAVSRIELLLAAESGMSREMACIRHALDIPPDQSVQPGVVDAFVRLNAEILELHNQLAELRGQAAVAWRYRTTNIKGNKNPDWSFSETESLLGLYEPLYARPVPPAASQPTCDVWKWCCEYQYNKDWPALDYDIFDHQHEAEEKARDTEGNVFPIYKSTQETQVDFLPKNLDRALTIMGMAIPESKEEFNFQSERWIQRLINAVLRMGKQSQPYTVPDGWVLVPLAPTPEMTGAAIGCGVTRGMGGSLDVNYSDIYTAMVSAAPQVERKDGDA